MSDVQIEDQNDDGFDAELETARLEQEGDNGLIDDGADEGQDDEKPAVSKDVEKLERVAADKSRMAHAERRKRQEAEARAMALEERLARLEKPAQDDPFSIDIPDETQDPIGALEAQKRIIQAFLKGEQDKQRQGQAQTAQERQFQQINTRMQEFETDFRDMNPDYDQAAEHFRKTRTAELEEQGYEGTDLQKALTNELVGLVARSMQSGKDPAEVVYKLAKNRGFAGSGATNVDKQPSKLQTIERGQKASRSLSGMSGKTGDGELSPEAIMKLDGAAFDAAFAKLRQQARKTG